ncbi:glutathione S-transferase family protein [Endozoicomonas arenosclerae]|uniref:glutathione S-transferase family protein n=1 Tax=Endozoicomonas arenosclerae TaxID=1633495 RepID=UPI000785835F|nr:glutathione S-transferase family protein [Endozoicomonas arenosclerae]
MYTLYTISGSCSTAIAILLEKLGMDYEVIHRDDVENYQDISPTHQVPALKHGDKIITEGAAIILYLLEQHPNEMLPRNAQDRADFYQALMFNVANLHPAYSRVLSACKYIPESEAKEAYLMTLGKNVSQLWTIIDKKLEHKDYMIGDAPTAIDYLIALYINWGPAYMPRAKIDIGKNIHRLAQHISTLPEYKAALKKERP